MRESYVLPMLFALSSTSACQEHVCTEEPGRCDTTLINFEPKRLATAPEQDPKSLRLSIRVAGDAFEKNILLRATQSNGKPFQIPLIQGDSDAHQYSIDLSKSSEPIVPGTLKIEFPGAVASNVVVYDAAPFASFKRLSVPTTNIRGYQRTTSYALTFVDGPTSTDEPATTKYLLAFGAIQTPPNDMTQSTKYTLDIASTTPLDPARSMMSAYAYNSQSNLWLGNIVSVPGKDSSNIKKLWFYYAQAAVFTDAYKLIRCPDMGNTTDNCSSFPTGITSGLSGPGRELFRSMAVDATGQVAVLTNDTKQEAYRFGSEFTQIQMSSGKRLRQLAVTAATTAGGSPDIYAVSEDNILLLYKFDNATQEYGRPFTLYDLKQVTPGQDVSSLAVGDINGDNFPDVIFAAKNAINFLIHTSLATTAGAPVFERASYSLVSSQSSYNVRSLSLGDIDQDGYTDVIAGSDAGLDAKITAASVVDFFLSNRPPKPKQ